MHGTNMKTVDLKYILMLISHLCIGLTSCLFPSGFPTKTLYAFLFFPQKSHKPNQPPTLWYDQWRTEGGWGVQTLPPEIPKALQNRAKLNPIVKTVKTRWI